MEKLEVQLAKQLPFVLYRKPNEHNVHAILQHNDTLNFVADYSESGFVFAPFDGRTSRCFDARGRKNQPGSTFKISRKPYVENQTL